MDQEIKKEFDDLAVIIKDSFGEMEKKVADRFDDLESRMATKDDLKQMATKDDLKQMATKDDLKNLETRLETKMDEKFGSLESEIFQIRQELKDIKKSLEILAKRTLEDTNVLARDVLELRHRVDFLEKQIQKFQIAAA